MPLKRVGPNYQDLTGSQETITIEPVPPAPSTDVTFTAAAYGTGPDGSPANIPDAAGKTSLTFNVLAGLHRLTFGLVSPSPQAQSVNIMQDDLLLCTVSVKNHGGVGSIRIVGVAPATGGRA